MIFSKYLILSNALCFLFFSCATTAVKQLKKDFNSPLVEIVEPSQPTTITGFYSGITNRSDLTYHTYHFKNMLKGKETRVLQVLIPEQKFSNNVRLIINEVDNFVTNQFNVKILFINLSYHYKWEKEKLNKIIKENYQTNQHIFIFSKSINTGGVVIHFYDNSNESISSMYLTADELVLKRLQRSPGMEIGIGLMYTGAIIFDVATFPVQMVYYLVLYLTNNLSV